MPVKEGTAQLKFNRAGANYLKKKNSILMLLVEYSEMNFHCSKTLTELC